MKYLIGVCSAVLVGFALAAFWLEVFSAVVEEWASFRNTAQQAAVVAGMTAFGWFIVCSTVMTGFWASEAVSYLQEGRE